MECPHPLERFSKTVFLRRSYVILGMTFGLVSESAVRICALDGTQCLMQGLSTLLQQSFDRIDKFLLVKFIWWSFVGFVDALKSEPEAVQMGRRIHKRGGSA